MTIRKSVAVFLSIVSTLFLISCGTPQELRGTSFEVGQSIESATARLTLTDITGFDSDYDINNDKMMDGDVRNDYSYILVIYTPENLSDEFIEDWEPSDDIKIVFNGKKEYTPVRSYYYYPYVYSPGMKSQGWWETYQYPPTSPTDIPSQHCKVFLVADSDIRDLKKSLQLKIRLNDDDTDYICNVR